MALVAPFRALRPPAGRGASIASPPYDVLDTREARALATSPSSFLYVSRPEIGLPEGTDEHADAVYAEAPRALARMRERGELVRDDEPRLYLYAQTMGAHRQTGLVACVSVADYDEDRIKKHEKTRADKEEDRIRHIDALSAHDEPVFLTYPARDDVRALVRAVETRPRDEDFVTPDGVRHEVWTLHTHETSTLVTAFGEVPALYVADGHHRSAAASSVHARRKGTAGEHDRFLAVLFPDDELQILAYHRVVRDDRRRSREALLGEISARFELTLAPSASPPRRGTFTIFDGERWHLATPREPAPDDPVAALDCSLCQDRLLAPVFGIEDPRRDGRVEFVGGIRGTGELEARVRSGRGTLAIALFPTDVGSLMAVSDAGRLMPPKSTWFEPKLRSGLFVHPFDE